VAALGHVCSTDALPGVVARPVVNSRLVRVGVRPGRPLFARGAEG